MADKNKNINNNEKHCKNVRDFCGDRNGYISLSEAAEYTPYSQEYLSLRARQGKLKSTKVSRDWMTTINWVADYLREHNGKNGDIKENKKFLENLTKSYGTVLKYGAVTAVLFLIVCLGLFSQNFKPSVEKVFSSAGEKYLAAKDGAKFSWVKQQMKIGKIFVSAKDQTNKILENIKDESFGLAQTFTNDYKNKIKNFNNGLLTAKNFTVQETQNFKTKISYAVFQSKDIAKNFVSQGQFVSAVFLDKTKEAGNFITGSLKPVKNLPKVLSSGKNLIKGKFLTLSQKILDIYKLTGNKSLAFASGVKNKINDVYSGGRKNVNGLALQFASLGGKTKSRASQTLNDLNFTTKQFTLSAKNNFSAVYQKVNNNIQKSASLIKTKYNHGTESLISGLAKMKENIINTGSNSKIVVLSLFGRTKDFIKENILAPKTFAFYTFKKSQNFVGEKLFALQASFKKGSFNSRNIINGKVIAFKNSVSKGWSGFNGYLGKNVVNIQKGVVSGSIVFGESVKNNINNVQISFVKSFTVVGDSTINGINLIKNSVTTSFTVTRNSAVSVVFSTRNFVKQVSQKVALKTGQSFVATNDKFVERPAEILSGSISSGVKVAAVKTNYNLKLAQKNKQDFNKDLKISLKQASKDMAIPYFASIEGIKKIKDGAPLLVNNNLLALTDSAKNGFNSVKKFALNNWLAGKNSVGNGWLAIRHFALRSFSEVGSSVSEGREKISDKLSNGYLALLNYLIPERAFPSESLINHEKIAKKSEVGVVVIPSIGGGGISSNKYLLSKIEESFSDEVKVEPSKDGNAGIIKPTQPAVPEEEYLYMIVPVKPEIKK